MLEYGIIVAAAAAAVVVGGKGLFVLVDGSGREAGVAHPLLRTLCASLRRGLDCARRGCAVVARS